MGGFSLFAQPLAQDGELWLNEADFSDNSIELKGEWAFTWHKFIDPKQPISTLNKTVPFTQSWNDISGLRFNGAAQGFASYKLILHSEKALEDMAFYVPEVYTTYQLYMNGERVASNGKPGSSLNHSNPYWLPQLARVDLQKGANTLVLHVSNYHFKGVPMHPFQLGTYEHLSFLFNFSKSNSLFVAGALLIAGLFALTVFYFQRNDLPFLFFALFAFFYTYRIICRCGLPKTLHKCWYERFYCLTVQG